MRKLITLVALLALALPAAALAEEGGPQNSEDPPTAQSHELTPGQHCKQLRVAMTLANFKSMYGTNATRSNALGKCVVRLTAAKRIAVANAVKACKAEKAMSDDEFKATHEGETFNEHYGSGKNGRNAHGKCVSEQAKDNHEEAVEAVVSAAKTCKAEKKMAAAAFAEAHGGKSFAAHYGTNVRKTNAFGKCVAAAVKKAAEAETAEGESTETT